MDEEVNEAPETKEQEVAGGVPNMMLCHTRASVIEVKW